MIELYQLCCLAQEFAFVSTRKSKMKTERFNKIRRGKLEEIFKKDKIVNVWRDIVKKQLRDLEIKDLYDHYDFNYNIEERAIAIRHEILEGSYKASQPLIYRLEKKLGICRHIVIPQPIDALVLQVLVESTANDILKAQPSINAFYSRDKHNMRLPHQVKFDEYLPLKSYNKWKQLQKVIYQFNEEKELIIVTDLSNYYDSIDMVELRKVFSSYSKIEEVVIDLLFRIIEEISWKPDYLPYSSRGLPTTNIEAIRLLAHSFLFEIDDVLKQKTNNSFTRWMDDITIGVNTKREGVETLSALSDMLKSRGLALNLAKTAIYNEEEAEYHFQINANLYLDSLAKTDENHPEYKKIRKEIQSKFKIHLKNTGAKAWDKVAKRYITLYGKLNIKNLLEIIQQVYIDHPELRPNLIYYLLQTGFNKQTSEILLKILSSLDIYDDISLFQLSRLVTQLEIPVDNISKEFLLKFEDKLLSTFHVSKGPFDFYSILWFKAKYNHPNDLLAFIKKYKNFWQTDTFIRRQVTAVLSRLLFDKNNEVIELLQNQISSGIINTMTLANQILQFSKIESLESKINLYLFPKTSSKIYSLERFLVLCSFLNSENIRNSKNVREKVLKYIKDPYYLKWLDAQYNIS